jgi:transposase-like protein
MARKKKASAPKATSGEGSSATSSAPKKKPARKVSTKRLRKYGKYSDADRSRILAAARKDKLTAAQVQKRFGVIPVTYYSWRKKKGQKRGPGRPRGAVVRSGSGGNLGGQLRTEVQTRIRAILPNIVRAEVSHYLDSVLGSSGGRRRRS